MGNFFQEFVAKAGVPNRVAAVASGLSLAAHQLVHKLEKHYAGKNWRKMAQYLAQYVAFGEGPLPPRAKELARKAELHLKQDPKNGCIGYLHEDGSYHYFSCKKEE